MNLYMKKEKIAKFTLFFACFAILLLISIGAAAECGIGDTVGYHENVPLYSNGCNVKLVTHWQCVEFAKRFYFQKYHYKVMEDAWDSIQIWHGNGDVWHTRPGLAVRYNKVTTHLPQPGDTLAFKGFYENKLCPHVAIVSDVNMASGEVHFVQQNVLDSNNDMLIQDYVNYTVDSSTGVISLNNYKTRYIDYEIIGWGHRNYEVPEFSRDGVNFGATYGIAGKSIHAHMSAYNNKDTTVLYDKIGIGGRGPEGETDIQDIKILQNVPILPDDVYIVNVNKIFPDSGDYIFSPYAEIGGTNPLPTVVDRKLVFSILNDENSVIVDDSEFNSRFDITLPVGTRNVLKDINTRDSENFQSCGYLYGSISVPAKETHVALWKPEVAGTYSVSVYIPPKGGYASVQYEIVPDGNSQNTILTEPVNQQNYSHHWKSLKNGCINRWQFTKAGYVRLRAVDINGVTSNRVAFDAIKFSYIPDFPDLSDDNSYKKDVLNLAAIGAIQGYPDGYFRPDKPVNRAEFLKILLIAARDAQKVQKLNADTKYPGFPDVNINEWYAPYVTEAYKARVIRACRRNI